MHPLQKTPIEKIFPKYLNKPIKFFKSLSICSICATNFSKNKENGLDTNNLQFKR